MDESGREAGDRGSLSSWNSDMGFLSIFKKSKASSPFEALNSVCLSRCQSDVIPLVPMRRRPTAFSRFSTGDSDIPSLCDMKHEPKFKPTAGKSGLLLSQASHGTFHLRQKAESLSPTYC